MIPDALAKLPRPFRPVELPGGGTVHVRSLTVAELLAIDARAEAAAEGGRAVRFVCLRAAAAVCDPAGVPYFPDATKPENADAAASAAAELFAPEQLEAINAAAVPGKDAAKN